MKRDQRKARAIKALSVTNSVAEAAVMAGVTERTLYNYLHDPGFIKELEKAYNSMLIAQTCDIEDQKRKAMDVLVALLDDPSPEIRLKAAKVILDNARKLEISMLGIFTRANEREEKDPLGFFR